jgi:phosphocarrier protein HPr
MYHMTEPGHSGTEGHTGPAEATIVLHNKAGLHARSAASLVKTAARFEASITLRLKGRPANARSLMELLRLGARQGDSIHITATGRDAFAALNGIKTLVENGFGEA